MFAAGFEGEGLPASERWRSLQWLGERTARDPRFAVAMVGPGPQEARNLVEQIVGQVQGMLPDGVDLVASIAKCDSRASVRSLVDSG